ncbi:unnamed protein product, partial [Symbiodinium microadriaticum]
AILGNTFLESERQLQKCCSPPEPMFPPPLSLTAVAAQASLERHHDDSGDMAIEEGHDSVSDAVSSSITPTTVNGKKAMKPSPMVSKRKRGDAK